MYPIVKAWVEEVAAGEFGGKGVVSTLQNGGLAYQEINDVDGTIPADVATKVEELIAGLTDGSITIS